MLGATVLAQASPVGASLLDDAFVADPRARYHNPSGGRAAFGHDATRAWLTLPRGGQTHAMAWRESIGTLSRNQGVMLSLDFRTSALATAGNANVAAVGLCDDPRHFFHQDGFNGVEATVRTLGGGPANRGILRVRVGAEGENEVRGEPFQLAPAAWHTLVAEVRPTAVPHEVEVRVRLVLRDEPDRVLATLPSRVLNVPLGPDTDLFPGLAATAMPGRGADAVDRFVVRASAAQRR